MAIISSFLTNKQFFTLQDINHWTRIITFRLFWRFYQLFERSFWRHPFTAEDQFVSNDVKFLKIRSDDPQVIQDEHEFEYIFSKSP